jgi:hypothetical protein
MIFHLFNLFGTLLTFSEFPSHNLKGIWYKMHFAVASVTDHVIGQAVNVCLSILSVLKVQDNFIPF